MLRRVRLRVESQSLTELGLHQNDIGEQGATALADALLCNSTLTEVSLYCNQKGQFWGVQLARALSGNKKIATLDIGGNQIGDAGVAALATVLGGDNTSLTDLHLDYNGISENGATYPAAFSQHAHLSCSTFTCYAHLP